MYERILVILAGLGALIVGDHAFAHHGRASYSEEIVTLEATVTDFRFINPHVQIYFDVTNEAGEVEHWQGELTAPNRLARAGWTKSTFVAGDQATDFRVRRPKRRSLRRDQGDRHGRSGPAVERNRSLILYGR